jgi:PhzF family phenazine biosynthesis protein
MQITAYIIDTFTTTPFRGSHTAVCSSHEAIAPSTMQAIARELNFPVTAFTGTANATGYFDISYYTPITGIDACGHATLAAARVLFDLYEKKDVTFHTPAAIEINARLEEDTIIMTYPRYQLETVTVNSALLNSLSVKHFLSAGFCKELDTLFIELESPEVLRSIQPDFIQMVASAPNIKEVVITSVSDTNKYDFLLRSFCPWIGIDEDPVTGSVHSALAPFWQKNLHKTQLTAYQCSERGGEVFLTVLDSTVELGGKTVTHNSFRIRSGESPYHFRKE